MELELLLKFSISNKIVTWKHIETTNTKKSSQILLNLSNYENSNKNQLIFVQMKAAKAEKTLILS